MGNFNATMSDKTTEDFCMMNNLESLIKKPVCSKNHENTTSIELIVLT